MASGRRIGLRATLTAAALAGTVLSGSGCMTYRGPHGVAATIEQRAGVELHREFGFKLGLLSTRITASLLHHWADDQDYRDLSGIGVAVFEVKRKDGATSQPVTAKDLGVDGWKTMFATQSDGEQLLVLVKPNDGEIRDMMFLSMDGDEVVVARLKGHLDRLIKKTLAAADRDGSHGARAAIGVGSH